jgi:hypothetical protein
MTKELIRDTGIYHFKKRVRMPSTGWGAKISGGQFKERTRSLEP